MRQLVAQCLSQFSMLQQHPHRLEMDLLATGQRQMEGAPSGVANELRSRAIASGIDSTGKREPVSGERTVCVLQFVEQSSGILTGGGYKDEVCGLVPFTWMSLKK
jgi:hypothetical protein